MSGVLQAAHPSAVALSADTLARHIHASGEPAARLGRGIRGRRFGVHDKLGTCLLGKLHHPAPQNVLPGDRRTATEHAASSHQPARCWSGRTRARMQQRSAARRRAAKHRRHATLCTLLCPAHSIRAARRCAARMLTILSQCGLRRRDFYRLVQRGVSRWSSHASARAPSVRNACRGRCRLAFVYGRGAVA